MSSHREAPAISKDPTADNTDVYAFRSPDAPDTITLIANFQPFELPYGGPNFNEFADDVVYQIKVNNTADAKPDVTFEFRFTTTIRNPNTFLYNIGPIASPEDTNWNRPQVYTVSMISRRGTTTVRKVLGTGLTCPPANVGVHSTNNYPAIANAAIHSLDDGRKVFAGPRADGFYVDLGSIFDLGDLRPFQAAYNPAIPPVLGNMPGVNSLRGLNVHTLAVQVPISDLTVDGSVPTDVMDSKATIGVWASANRTSSTFRDANTGKTTALGGVVQVSRLGNPLFNEVINPMAYKDAWNAAQPFNDRNFAKYVLHPELADLIANTLYPDAFPNLRQYVNAKKPRNDLAAILLTGIPAGVVDGFQNYTGPVQADMLRLNVAVPPKQPSQQNQYGLLGGDAAGFPNGRRVGDNITAVELRAIAGLTIPLVDPSYTPDDAAGALTDGTTPNNTPYGGPYLRSFPYLSHPNSGFTSKPGQPGGNLATG